MPDAENKTTIIILSEKPFEGEAEVAQREGCCICHNDTKILSEPFRLIKAGVVTRVLVVGGLSKDELRRMVVAARHNHVEVIEATSEDVPALL